MVLTWRVPTLFFCGIEFTAATAIGVVAVGVAVGGFERVSPDGSALFAVFVDADIVLPIVKSLICCFEMRNASHMTHRAA
jgi:hypothetical protein